MHVMILAAGRGERMRPLTDSIPKPMLPLAGKPLIQQHVERLVDNGFQDIVINHAHLGEQIEAHLGDGRTFGARIAYSREKGQPLETGGGMRRALPMLGDRPFIAINADIWTDYPLQNLALGETDWAHLVLVDNPAHHPAGDFVLRAGRVLEEDGRRLTFSGIGMYRPALFDIAGDNAAFPLAQVLRSAIAADRVSGEQYAGRWIDIGTPERLKMAEKIIK